MSSIFSALFGSSPKATTAPPTNLLNPTDTELLNTGANDLLFGVTPPGTPGAITGPGTTATAGNLIGNSLTGLENIAGMGGLNGGTIGAPTAGTTGNVNTAQSVFDNLLTAGAPALDPATMATFSSDANNAFKTGYLDPATTNFNTNIIPAITGKYGQSSGGAFSSDALKAREDAGNTFEQNANAVAANYATAADSLGLSAAEANQNAALTNAKTQAGTLALATDTANLPTATTAANTNLLTTLLGAGSDTTQTGFTDIQSLIDQMLQSGNTPTVAPGNTTVNPGSPGLLGSILGSSGGSNALFNALGLSGGSGGGGGGGGGSGSGGLIGAADLLSLLFP